MARPELIGAVTRYADRVHRALGSGHHVASPLGAWLLLTLVARAARGADRARLEAVLGLDADTAAGYATGMLGRPHPAVRQAAAA